MRRALFSHVTTYTLTFVPALIWLSDSLSVWACVGLAFVIFIPHLIQDDGSLLAACASGQEGRYRGQPVARGGHGSVVSTSWSCS